MKRLSSISVADLERSPVWQFDRQTEVGDDLLKPSSDLPVDTLENCIVGTQVSLSCGRKCWAILSNINLKNKQATEHFLALSVEKDGKWFDLARYHDVDYRRRGPDQLGAFLELSPSEVFPITYDISGIVLGPSDVMVGAIAQAPSVKLTQAELIELSLE